MYCGALARSPSFQFRDLAAARAAADVQPLRCRHEVRRSCRWRRARHSGFRRTRLRADISSTLFLTDPDDYDGGELVVEDTYGTHSVKLPAGDIVVYPASSLHHVTPITRGSRWSSFFWTQSMVRDDGKRMLLYDLDMAIIEVRQKLGDHERASVALTSHYHNLLRRWAEL